MNFRFESPWWLLGLLALPLLEWRRRRTAREAVFVYSSLTLVKGILQMNRTLASRLLLAARWIGLVLLILGMARPQWAVGKAPRKASGIDIAVAFNHHQTFKNISTTSSSSPPLPLPHITKIVHVPTTIQHATYAQIAQ
jgi:hypothetical protein